MKSLIYAVARDSFENALRRAFFESLGVSEAACDCMTSNCNNEHYFNLIQNNDISLSENRNEAQRRLANSNTQLLEKKTHRFTVFCVESDEGSLSDFYRVFVDACASRVEEGKSYQAECRNYGSKNNYTVVYAERTINGLCGIAAWPDDFILPMGQSEFHNLRSASHHGAMDLSKFIFSELSKDERRTMQSVLLGC